MFSIYLALIRPLYYLYFEAIVKLKPEEPAKTKYPPSTKKKSLKQTQAFMLLRLHTKNRDVSSFSSP